MTIKECIDIVDNLKPNQYTIKEKVMWLSFIEAIIINEVLKTHEGYDGRYDMFEEYSEDKLTVKLIVTAPYDRLYTAYLKMKIDEANGETARYNNSAALYNSYMTEYKKYYNKTHMPIDVTKKTKDIVIKVPMGNNLSDAEIENIIKELTYIITEQVGNAVSEDRIYDIAMRYMQNNTELFKGKEGKPGKDGEDGQDGYTPKKGVDYYTEVEKQELIDKIKDEVSAVNGDWNQNDETALDYIKNRTHYDYPELIAEGVSNGDWQVIPTQKPIDIDKYEYVVVIDGVELKTSISDNRESEDLVIIRDAVSYSDILHYYSESTKPLEITIVAGLEAGKTIQLYQKSAKPLDEKYIPKSIARLSDVQAMIGTVNNELESILNGGVD